VDRPTASGLWPRRSCPQAPKAMRQWIQNQLKEEGSEIKQTNIIVIRQKIEIKSQNKKIQIKSNVYVEHHFAYLSEIVADKNYCVLTRFY
jgi:hypothetical protein